MDLYQKELILKKHSGSCPICSSATHIKNAQSAGEGKIYIQIECINCGFEFEADCNIENISCELMEHITGSR